MFLRFVLLCLCITPLLPLSGLDYMVPGSHPAAANATNSTALTRELSLSLCARPFARPYYSWLQSNGPLPCPSTTWCPAAVVRTATCLCPSLIPALTTLPLPFTYTPLHAVNTPPAARYTPEAASRQPARLLPVSRGTRQPAGGLGPCWHPVRRAYMMPRAPALAMLRSYHHENTRSH